MVSAAGVAVGMAGLGPTVSLDQWNAGSAWCEQCSCEMVVVGGDDHGGWYCRW